VQFAVTSKNHDAGNHVCHSGFWPVGRAWSVWPDQSGKAAFLDSPPMRSLPAPPIIILVTGLVSPGGCVSRCWPAPSRHVDAAARRALHGDGDDSFQQIVTLVRINSDLAHTWNRCVSESPARSVSVLGSPILPLRRDAGAGRLCGLASLRHPAGRAMRAVRDNELRPASSASTCSDTRRRLWL